VGKGVKMIGKIRNPRLGIFLNVGIGIVFLMAAVIIVIIVNYGMRQQALIEAQAKARIILDRNLATHNYFSQIMKPSIFAWSEPFRSKEYFDHTWMSSTYAIREIEKYFKSLNPSGYSFKDAAIDARSPENEADEYERVFLEKLAMGKKLESDIAVRNIDGKPYLVVLRKGEVMEASCLRCHSTPQNAPKGLTDHYGSERSFNRKAGDAISAVSLRIPLSEAYAAANIFSLKLSAILIGILICIFTIQYGFYRRYLLEPLNVMRDKAKKIATYEDHLGEQIPQPFGRELTELTASFNEMSTKLRHERDSLEELVAQRTEALRKEKGFAESLIQTAQAIVLVLDTTGHIVRINPYMEEVSGCRLEEVQGEDWFSAFLPERDRNSTRELFLKAIGDIQTRGNINPIVTKDGREIDIEWRDKTLKDENGKVVGLLSIGQDITERKQAEAAIQESHVRLERNLKGAIDVISETIEAKGPYVPGHHRHISALTSAIARELGLTDFQVQGIELAAAVYDIGLMTIPIEFLQDSERLDGVKLTLYQGYPKTGHDALKKIEFPWPIAEIILQHRECYDGSGFPQGIRGEEILIEARILAVANALVDLTTHKSFRNAFPVFEALEKISSHSGAKYDPDAVAACLRLFKEKGYTMEG
jgi:hypothetical protein